MGRGLASCLSLISWEVICFHGEVGKCKAWARNPVPATRPGDEVPRSLSRASSLLSAASSSARTAETRTAHWRRVPTRGGRWRPRPLEGLARRASVFRCGVHLLPGRAGGAEAFGRGRGPPTLRNAGTRALGPQAREAQSSFAPGPPRPPTSRRVSAGHGGGVGSTDPNPHPTGWT